MEAIDLVKINFNPDQLKLLNICLAFLMFGVALDISREDFLYVVKAWRSIVIGLISQLVFLPILTLILIYIFHPPVSVAVGMVLVSVCPGGNVSNFMVHLAKGNTALSVTLTSIVTLGATILTPVGFYFWTSFTYGEVFINQELSVSSLDILRTVSTLIVIPLIIGMYFNANYSSFCQKIRKPVKIISILIFIVFVIAGIFANLHNIINHVSKIILIVIVHNGAALMMGYFFARLLQRSTYDSRAISIETGIQNSGLALIIIFNFYDGLGGMALITACWGIWHLITGGLLATYWSRKPT
jgi:Predicted Na+-dependent transporter